MSLNKDYFYYESMLDPVLDLTPAGTSRCLPPQYKKAKEQLNGPNLLNKNYNFDDSDFHLKPISMTPRLMEQSAATVAETKNIEVENMIYKNRDFLTCCDSAKNSMKDPTENCKTHILRKPRNTRRTGQKTGGNSKQDCLAGNNIVNVTKDLCEFPGKHITIPQQHVQKPIKNEGKPIEVKPDRMIDKNHGFVTCDGEKCTLQDLSDLQQKKVVKQQPMRRTAVDQDVAGGDHNHNLPPFADNDEAKINNTTQFRPKHILMPHGLMHESNATYVKSKACVDNLHESNATYVKSKAGVDNLPYKSHNNEANVGALSEVCQKHILKRQPCATVTKKNETKSDCMIHKNNDLSACRGNTKKYTPELRKEMPNMEKSKKESSSSDKYKTTYSSLQTAVRVKKHDNLSHQTNEQQGCKKISTKADTIPVQKRKKHSMIYEKVKLTLTTSSPNPQNMAKKFDNAPTPDKIAEIVDSKIIGPIIQKMHRISERQFHDTMQILEDLERIPALVRKLCNKDASAKK